MKTKIFLLSIIGLIVFSCGFDPPQKNEKEQFSVVTAHYLASEVGANIIRKGGNAFDAAIAVQFALAVVYPRAGNIGGGGFAVLRTNKGEINSLDFREKAPLLAHKDMYLDSLGNPIKDLSKIGALAVGVPGTVEGMVKLHEKYGSLEWKDLLEPSIMLAEKGFEWSECEAKKIIDYRERIQEVNKNKNISFFNISPQKGALLVQSDFAEILKNIRDEKGAGFYSGKCAKLIVEEMSANGGLISMEDLELYESKWRKPLQRKYRDHNIISMPLPSSGGIVLFQILKAIEKYDLASLSDSERIHLTVEAQRRAFADRAIYLGDSDFSSVPVDSILTDEYIEAQMASFNSQKKTESFSLMDELIEQVESFETTHFSIVDYDGNAISITTTLNGNYGSKLYVEGGGFFLNNEMDDFSVKPGVPNQYGLIGNEANSIVSQKRMLSSMTPTIVTNKGELKMVLGSPGGSTIITTVMQNIVNFIDLGMDIDEAVNSPRFHSQCLPDKIYYEENVFDSITKTRLISLGHCLEKIPQLGVLCTISINSNGEICSCTDCRHDDSAAINK